MEQFRTENETILDSGQNDTPSSGGELIVPKKCIPYSTGTYQRLTFTHLHKFSP